MSRERVVFVYDDSVEVPGEVTTATGVRVFGDLLSRGTRLADSVTRLARRGGCGEAVHLLSRRDVAGLRERVRAAPHGQRYLVLPSSTAPTAPEDAVLTFLRKLTQLHEPVLVTAPDGGSTGVALLDAPLMAAHLDALTADGREDHLAGLGETVETVTDPMGLVDLRDQARFVEFLSGGFTVRHFNRIEEDRFVITKRSADKDKMRREARFHSLLPASVQHFFVQPYGYEETADGASYRMRRLYVPDTAVQWVHHAFAPADFDRFMDQVTHFLAARPVREVPVETGARQARALYVEKVRSRVDALLEHPVGRAVDSTLRAGGHPDGVAGMLQGYLALHERLTRARRPERLALTHGDLCFSNILYSQPSQMLQLIDPRGADEEAELYSDAYYDLAKLSHSVLGGYDLVHAGLYRIEHDGDLRLHLHLEAEDLQDLQLSFVRRVEQLGFDVRLVRLYEASLFLSMLALHVDAPKKVLAFALRAQQVLDSLATPGTKDKERT